MESLPSGILPSGAAEARSYWTEKFAAARRFMQSRRNGNSERSEKFLAGSTSRLSIIWNALSSGLCVDLRWRAMLVSPLQVDARGRPNY